METETDLILYKEVKHVLYWLVHAWIFHNQSFSACDCIISFWLPCFYEACFLCQSLVENSEHVNHIVIMIPPTAFLYSLICLLVLSCQRYLPTHTHIHTVHKCWMVSCWIYILQYEHMYSVPDTYILELKYRCIIIIGPFNAANNSVNSPSKPTK